MKERINDIFANIMLVLSLTLIIINIYGSHILRPIKILDADEIRSVSYIEAEPIILTEDESLDDACYIGELDDRVPYRLYVNGTLNYLCKTYSEKRVKISVVESTGKRKQEGALADTSQLNGIRFYHDNLKKFHISKKDVERVVFHEYIHLLMIRNMSNSLTIEKKSEKLIDGTISHYKDFAEANHFPTEYSRDCHAEQIAEILSLYMINRVTDNPETKVYVKNFEQELYEQLMYNL